jgi:DNA-binding HxlR family transcriptional regulator
LSGGECPGQKSFFSLESHGILTREVIPTIPPEVRYTLTEKGMDLQNVVNQMKIWGEKWSER